MSAEISRFAPLPYGWWNVYSDCAGPGIDCAEACPGVITTEEGHFFATADGAVLEPAEYSDNYRETVFKMDGPPA